MFLRKKRSSLIIVGMICCTFMSNVLLQDTAYAETAGVADSSTSSSVEQLSQVATSLYRNALDYNLSAVREDVGELTRQVEKFSFDGLTTVEGMHALTETIVEVKEASASVQAASDSLQHASAKLRLAVDSLAHPDKALWLQYYKIIKEDLLSIEEEASNEEGTAMVAKYAELESHYETIRPAAIIRRQPYEIERFDSWMSYLKGLTLRNGSEPQDILDALKQGDEFANALFGKEKDETAFVPFAGGPEPWAANLFIGSAIVAVLAYVGYRKYRGINQSFFKL
ncbi:sporulation protein YpjB [Paenibacillus sp. Marseille-Q4541]|uniref:sporulation protein YpjB n=1 Tax=Paenibacillus sp. Marseille-Q4541 TaxID=2831522 RepID=UPI001BAE10BB|nr:sporulation protein YpjB [Paenibacillus sp. Marseille-Q4541]